MVLDRKTIVFILPDEGSNADDYSDDFYDLTLSEAQALYREYLHKRKELEDKPLKTSFMRSEEEAEKTTKFIKEHKFCIVRVQFSDRIILQGIFEPSEGFHQVNSFVKLNLIDKDLDFYLFSAPPKQVPDEGLTLLELKFAPAVKLYLGLKSGEQATASSLLKPALLLQLHSLSSASDQAQLYRAAESSKKREETKEREDVKEERRSKRTMSQTGPSRQASSSSKPHVPKWFKPQ